MIIALFVMAPLIVVVVAPFFISAPAWSHVVEYTLGEQLINSFRLVLGASMLAILFGTASAWILSAYRFPLKRFFSWALIVPLAIPTYIVAYIYGDLLGPTGKWSLAIGEATGTYPDVMDMNGLTIILAAVLYPYVYLPARALFSYGLGDLIGSARILSNKRFQPFIKVAWPLALPAILGGALLVAMEILNDYGAAKYFGIPTLTTGIFNSWHNKGDLGTAMRIGTLLLAVVLVLRAIERIRRSRSNFAYTPRPLSAKKLTGLSAITALAFCSIPLIIGGVIPIAKMVYDTATGNTLRKALGYELLPATFNALMLSLIAGILTVLIGLLFTYAFRYSKSRTLKRLTGLASLGYVIPGAVIAVGVMYIAGAIDRQIESIVLIGSFAIIVYAMAVRFLAIALENLQAGSEALDEQVSESALVLGSSPLRTFFLIDSPMMAKSLAAAAILVFVEVIKELPLTLILKPFNFETLASQAFRFAGIELLEESSVAALLILLCSLIPIFLLERGVLKQG